MNVDELIIVCCDCWLPSEDEWQRALLCVSDEERTRIARFRRPQPNGAPNLIGRFNVDAKRSLLGRLIIRRVLCNVYDCVASDIELKRSDFGKPLLRRPPPRQHSNNANQTIIEFNVSHADRLVAFFSTGVKQCSVGVDVVALQIPSRANRPAEAMSEFFSHFQLDVFTANEWQTILRNTNTQSIDSRLEFHQHAVDLFFIHWALKEAYVKALGEGIGFGLTRIEFTLMHKHEQRDENEKEKTILAENNKEEWIKQEDSTSSLSTISIENIDSIQNCLAKKTSDNCEKCDIDQQRKTLPNKVQMKLDGEIVENIEFQLIYGSFENNQTHQQFEIQV